MAAAQASYDKMSKDVERFQRLRDAGAVSQLQLEEVQLGLENSRTQVTGVQQQLKYTTVKSSTARPPSRSSTPTWTMSAPATPSVRAT